MITLRKITPEDNDQISKLVKTVMTELNCDGEGFSLHDTELEDMFESYNKDGHTFLVLSDKNQVVLGCGGIGQLKGEKKVCELKKMYFYTSLRGRGQGKLLMDYLLNFAKENYEGVYIETMDHMESARKLYEKYGFKQIESPMGDTGHFGCNTFYYLDLNSFKDQS